MRRSNSFAKKLAIISGILLLISGTSGVAMVKKLAYFVMNYVGNNQFVMLSLSIILLVASFGGITVIIGGYFYGRNRVTLGRFLVTLGSGMGILGLLITVVIAVYTKSWAHGGLFSIGSIGVLLAVMSTVVAKKV